VLGVIYCFLLFKAMAMEKKRSKYEERS